MWEKLIIAVLNIAILDLNLCERRSEIEGDVSCTPVKTSVDEFVQALAVPKTLKPKKKIAPALCHSEQFENLNGNGKRHMRDEDIGGQNINPILRMHRENELHRRRKSSLSEEQHFPLLTVRTSNCLETRGACIPKIDASSTRADDYSLRSLIRMSLNNTLPCLPEWICRAKKPLRYSSFSQCAAGTPLTQVLTTLPFA